MMKLHYLVILLSALGQSSGWQAPFRPAARSQAAASILPTQQRPVPTAAASPLFANTPEVALEGKEAEWTKKRFFNAPLFRSVALLGVLAAAGLSSPGQSLPVATSATIHMLSFGTWFGTVAYTTFVAGITMFKNLPKKTFGRLQAKLFPKYFALCSASVLLQLVTLKNLPVGVASTKALGVALVMTLLNQFILEPKSTENMMERYRLEEVPGATDSEEYKKLKSNFGKFHGMSSLTNLIALCAGVAHAVYLGGALVA
jgi:hypothetical protein